MSLSLEHLQALSTNRLPYVKLVDYYDALNSAMEMKETDSLGYNLLIHGYLVTEKEVRQWSEIGWVKSTAKQVRDMIERAVPGIKPLEITHAYRLMERPTPFFQLTNMGTTKLRSSFGICMYANCHFIPVPPQDIAVRIPLLGLSMSLPWNFQRLMQRKHTYVKTDGGKVQRDVFLWYPPGIQKSLRYNKGLVHGKECMLVDYQPFLPEHNLELALDAFCELYGCSWSMYGRMCQIASPIINNKHGKV